MCDYSLHGIRNRLAQKDEVLVVHRFHTGSKGLTSLEYLNPTAQPKGLLAALKTIGVLGCGALPTGASTLRADRPTPACLGAGL